MSERIGFNLYSNRRWYAHVSTAVSTPLFRRRSILVVSLNYPFALEMYLRKIRPSAGRAADAKELLAPVRCRCLKFTNIELNSP